MARPLVLSRLVCLVCLGCGGPGDELPLTEQTDACDHFLHGPSQAWSASPDLIGAPDAARYHERLDVGIPKQFSQDYLGYVDWRVDEAVTVSFFYEEAYPVVYLDGDGVEISPASVAESGFDCERIARIDTVPVPAAGMVLQLGPSQITLPRVVAIEPGDAIGHAQPPIPEP